MFTQFGSLFVDSNTVEEIQNDTPEKWAIALGTPTAQPKEKVSRPRVGSGARFRQLIAQGRSDAECVAIVRAEFPTSRATVSDARWNRNALKTGRYAN